MGHIIDENKINDVVKFLKEGNFHQALNYLKKLEEDNNHFIIHWYLGHTYFKLHCYSAAVEHIKKSIELNSKDSLNLNFLGEIYLEINEYDEAIKLFNEVLEFEENNKIVILNLAKAYLALGKIEKSEKYFNSLLKKDPLNFSYDYSLIKINKKYLTKKLIKEINKNEKNLDNISSIYSKLILAKQAEVDNNYVKEINYLTDAHRVYLINKKRSSDQQFNYYTNLLPQFLSKIDHVKIDIKDNISPIFIMGLPRSGTTLVEKIITSGKKFIDMGGETDVFDKVFFSKQIIKNYDEESLTTDFSFNQEGITYLRDEILKQYNQQNFGDINSIFTDKSISNFLYIDLIRKLFPNSKIVYCYRNPLANLIGLLRAFLPNIFWSHSLNKIFTMFNLYFSKLEQIQKNSIINFKLIKLEELTENPEKISKELFRFLDLEWSASCIQKNDKKMVFKTASNLQVRNKIENHDLEYTKNYREIFEKLGFNY
jgi:tetratricopeptide (TPR) repeat protein